MFFRPPCFDEGLFLGSDLVASCLPDEQLTGYPWLELRAWLSATMGADICQLS